MSGTFNQINISKGKSIRMYTAPEQSNDRWNMMLKSWIEDSNNLAEDLYDAGLRLIMILPGLETEEGEEDGVFVVPDKAMLVDVKFGMSVPETGVMALYPPFSLDVLLHEAMHYFMPELPENDILGNEEPYIEKYSADVAKTIENHPTMWPLRSVAKLTEFLAEEG